MTETLERGYRTHCDTCDVPMPPRRPGTRGPLPKWCDPCKIARNTTHTVIRPKTERPCDDCGTVVYGVGKRIAKRCENCQRLHNLARIRAARGDLQWNTCQKCGKEWSRPQTRGQRPKRCPVCADLYSTRMLHPETSRRGDERRVARMRMPGSEKIVPRVVFERDGWMCGLCHIGIDESLQYPDPMCATVDHVVPLALGGSHIYDNVQAAHFRCNTSKGARI